jgi:hypothetical protein
MDELTKVLEKRLLVLTAVFVAEVLMLVAILILCAVIAHRVKR